MMRLNRRQFIKSSCAAAACTCLGSLCLHSCSPFSSISDTVIAPRESYRIENGQVILNLEQTPSLSSEGGSVKLEFEHPDTGALTKIILAHPEATEYPAFSNICTHKGKELEYKHADSHIECVSGHSIYDMEGNVLEGNADSPLETYPTKLEGKYLIVTI